MYDLGGFAIDRRLLRESSGRILSPGSALFVHFGSIFMILAFSSRDSLLGPLDIYRLFGQVGPSPAMSVFVMSDLKDARRKIMQIDGGITSRSLFFDPVRPI